MPGQLAQCLMELELQHRRQEIAGVRDVGRHVVLRAGIEELLTARDGRGHALVALATPGSEPVHKVSIIPRGIGSLGYTIQRPIEDRYLMSKAELENKMTVLMGGRAAESLVFGEFSTGAGDDLNKATDIARSMVMRYGMDETLGHAIYAEDRPTFLEGTPAQPNMSIPWYSQETAREIDTAVRQLVGEAFERAVAVLTAHRKELDETAKLLLQRETLTAEDLPAIGPDDAKAAE